MTKIDIGKQIYLDGEYWIVTLMTSAYATLQKVNNPKISKMIRL